MLQANRLGICNLSACIHNYWYVFRIFFCSPPRSLRAQRKANSRLAAPQKSKYFLGPCHSGFNLCALCDLCGEIIIRYRIYKIVYLGLPVLRPWGKTVGGFVVWNFEFRLLEFICNLFFGAWNFASSNKVRFTHSYFSSPTFFSTAANILPLSISSFIAAISFDRMRSLARWGIVWRITW